MATTKKKTTSSTKKSTGKKTKNGIIMDNDIIDINSVNYEKVSAENLINNLMGIYGFNINLERAFPNVRDGLKPVQRKIIYSGFDAGYRSNKPFFKSLRYIGEISKFYVHGDASSYSTLMNMAQDFYCKNPLIEVHGNYGSITGDSPAAARYTESRLSQYTDTMLVDFTKESVDWKENFDNTLLEPTVLPFSYPNLLINGSYGIGQGFLGSIPSHNFKDIVDRTIMLIKNPEVSIDELIKDLIPDYPTGGVIINKKDLANMYKTGQGTIRLRGKIETNDKGNLVITSIPYMKSTGTILDAIQKAVKEGKITGISGIKDNTNGVNGVNIIIEIKRGNDPKVVESQLYRYTPIQDSITFQLICTTSDMLHFKYFNFKEALEEWIKFRKTSIKRLFNSKIAVVKKKIHIDEGLLIALDPKNMDKIIKMIRNAKDSEEVRKNLISKYKMTNIQAEYISNLRLVQLCNMEIEKISDDLEKQKALLDEYLQMFKDKKKLDNYIIKQLEDGVKKFNSPRLTEAIDVDLNNINESIIENTSHTLFITNEGFIKKVDGDKIRVQNTQGQGINVGKLKESDFIIETINCNNLDEIIFFTNQGRCFNLKTYEIKDSNLNSYGILLETLLNFKNGEKVITALKMNKDDYENNESFLLFATREGLIKKTNTSLYKNIQKSGMIAVDLNDNDELVKVISVKYDMDIIVATDKGSVIRYNTLSVPTTKRITRGVKSIVLGEDEHVVSFDNFENNDDTLCMITSKGNGKRIEMKSLIATDRTKKTKPVIKLSSTEKVVSVFFVNEDDELTIVGSKKLIKVPAIQIPVKLKTNSGDKIVSIGKGEKILLATK